MLSVNAVYQCQCGDYVYEGDRHCFRCHTKVPTHSGLIERKLEANDET